MEAVDTSVVIAAASPWHDAHHSAVAACGDEAQIPFHVVTEAYSVLTRTPEPFRTAPAVAAEFLTRRWSGRVVAPLDVSAEDLPRLLAEAGVFGGATYDGLVALTAKAHNLCLLSLDQRAERTYRALGIDYRILT